MRELLLYSETFLNCVPLLSEILKQSTWDEEMELKIRNEIDQLADCEGKTLLAQKLSTLKPVDVQK